MKTILLSRTDKIGDVVLTLPMAGIIKKHFPDYKILFLVSRYTISIARKSRDVDKVYDWDKVKKGEELLPHVDYFIHVFPDPEISGFARSKNIKHRVGTSHRLHHWRTCNHLVHFTRKRSNLHESQLNMKLLHPLGIKDIPGISEMHQYVNWKKAENSDAANLLTEKFNLVFHMKSMGSAKEWALSNYLKVAQDLSPDRFQIFITGTSEEGQAIKKEIPEIFKLLHVRDVTSRFSLTSFMSFIEQCDGLLACSTGPLHIASISGIKTVGLYPVTKPMHAGRWRPIGKDKQVISEKSPSNDSMLNVEVADVKKVIEGLI